MTLMIWCGTSCPHDSGAQAVAPLPVEVALAQPAFQAYAPISLSPDDAWIAYTLRYPNRVNRKTVESWYTATGVPSTAVGARVRITDARTGRTLTVGDDAATSWAPSWSPSGRYLAFYSDADGRARLWVRETTTGRTRRVSDAIVRAHRATQFPRWTPDSRHVVMPILPYGSRLPEDRSTSPGVAADSAREHDSATVTVLRADPALPYGGQGKRGNMMSTRESLYADLALVDVASGSVRTIATGYWPHEFSVAPDGRFVAFSSERPPVFRSRWMVPYDLMVVALHGRNSEPLRTVISGAAIANYARGVFWSPRGATLLYSATDSVGQEQYFAAVSSDWVPRRLATTGVAGIAGDSIASSTRSFWWDEGGDAFYIMKVNGIAIVSMPDGMVRSVVRAPAGYEPLSLVERQSHEAARTGNGKFLIVAFRHDSTKRMGFMRVDLATGAWRVLREEDRHYGSRRDLPTDVTNDGRVVFRSEDAVHPTDVWIASSDLASARQVTHVAPEMERFTYGATRLIDFTTTSGASRRGTLLLPSGYRPGIRYPLVVYPYPVEARSNNVHVFGLTGPGVENMQLLATRGFAVLAPDVAPFDWTDEMRELASIILRGVDRAIALGVADSTRLGIMGHSWGGYTTLALIAQSPRFDAAVMRGGMGDQATMTGTLQPSGYAYGVMLQELKFGGTLWDQRERYHRNSPIYLLNQVRTPLLIIHGEGETTVPIFLADQVFAGLQRLGREVEFARYARENHVESLWSYPNQRDYLTRMLGWFESHLGRSRDGKSISAPGRR